MKKIAFFLLIAGLSIGMLTGCLSTSPTDTVNEFLTAVQKGDHEKARTFVGNSTGIFNFDNLIKDNDGMDGKAMFQALTKHYKFEGIIEVSNKEGEAEVKATATSVEFFAAYEKSMDPTTFEALANATSSEEKVELNKKVYKELLKNLSDKDAKMVTREVTFMLQKDKDGNYKIVSNEQLAQAVIANWGKVPE